MTIAVKAGQILHDAYGFVIDRIQTGGVSGLNIPEEKIYEVGNFQAVATIRDTPDLTFSIESFDVSTEIEALLTFTDPTTVTPGTAFDLENAVPLDVISPIKDNWNVYTAHRGVVIPYLTLESTRYRFDMKGNSSQTQSMRGDSYFFTDGSPYYEEFAGDGTTATFAISNGPALPYNYLGHVNYMLGVSVVLDGVCTRLFLGEDYTNTATGFTLTNPAIAPATSTLRVVYGSATVVTYAQSVHQGVDVKPAAIRGKSIDVYVGDNSATPTMTRWTSVQSAEVNWSVTLDKDEEFGNAQYVGQDHNVPDVKGNVVVKPRDVAELWAKVQQVTNVPVGEVAGVLTSATLPLEFRLSDPDTGTRLKTIYIPDARFKPPAVEGKVQAKLMPTMEWTSDAGKMLVYDGARP